MLSALDADLLLAIPFLGKSPNYPECVKLAQISVANMKKSNTPQKNELIHFLSTSHYLIDSKQTKAWPLSYSILNKALSIFQFSSKEEMRSFIDFYEKSVKRDQTAIISMIQLPQFISRESAVKYFDHHSLRKYFLSLGLFSEKNSMIKSSVSITMTQLTMSIATYILNTKPDEGLRKMIISFADQLEEFTTSIEEK